MFQTEYEFTLPKGLVDDEGNLHKKGIMRLATAADEIKPLKDSRIKQNPGYLIIILLSRVLVKLGTIDGNEISPATIENLFASDLSYLQEFYQRINGEGSVMVNAKCPKCREKFEVNIGLGE